MCTVFGLFKRGDDKSPLKAINGRGTVLAGQMEYPCRLRAGSDTRLEITLDRAAGLSGSAVVVDLERGLALDVTVTAAKAGDVSFDVGRSHDLRGLVPARLSRARDVFNRR